MDSQKLGLRACTFIRSSVRCSAHNHTGKTGRAAGQFYYGKSLVERSTMQFSRYLRFDAYYEWSILRATGLRIHNLVGPLCHLESLREYLSGSGSNLLWRTTCRAIYHAICKISSIE